MKRFSILLFFLLVLISCNNYKTNGREENNDVELDYSNITSYAITYDELITLDSNFELYIYSTRCGHCNSIKQYVIEYVKSKNINEIYLMEYDSTNISIINNEYQIVGENINSNFVIYGYPILLNINKKIISNYYLGINEILNYIG